MAIEFAKTIKNLRTSQGLSQLELADKLFVTRSTVARWETGTRVPDANVVDFCIPSEALKYAQENPVDLAFVDIKMGHVSGFDVCQKLLEISSRTQVLYLTAYREYSFDAWSTGASGFLLKPLSVDAVKEAVSRLPRPIMGVTQ